MIGLSTVVARSELESRNLGYLIGAASGGTLGSQRVGGGEYVPVRGYNPIPPAMRPLPELDLQMTWLALLGSDGSPGSPHPFTRAYGETLAVRSPASTFAARNLHLGLVAPASGSLGNTFAESFGAAAASGLFGCVCPGDPSEAARLAGLAATVDHAREGVLCAMFVAAVCSSLFAAKRLSDAIAVALKMVPAESATAACVRAAVSAALDAPMAPAEGRKRIQAAASQPDYRYGPLNAGLFVYSLLAGMGMYADSVCLAVSLGGDSAALGVAVGGAMGLLVGAEGVDDHLREPIGDRLLTTGDIPDPKKARTFGSIAKEIAKVAWRMRREGAPVTLGDSTVPEREVPSAVSGESEAAETEPTPPEPTAGVLDSMKDSTRCRPMWSLSPNAQVIECCGLRVTFEFQEPPLVYPGRTNRARIVIENLGAKEVPAEPNVKAPEGWTLACRPQPALLRPGSSYEFCAVAQAPAGPPEAGKLTVQIGECTFDAALLRPNGWMVVGPFPNPEGTAFDKHYRAEDVYGRDEVFMLRSNLPGRWQPRWTEGPWIPLDEDFGGSPGVLYLRTILVSAEARSVRIVAATDDGLVLWLNREKKLWYHDHHEAAPLPQPPYVAKVDLRRGDNELMLKVLRCLHPCLGVWVYVLDDLGQTPVDIAFDETRA